MHSTGLAISEIVFTVLLSTAAVAAERKRINDPARGATNYARSHQR